MLEYDNSAFYYFALSIISFYVVPSWYRILKKVKTALFSSDQEIGAVARTAAERKKAESLKKTSKGLKTLNSSGFLVNLFITCALSAIVVYLAISVSQNGEIHSFDPFQVLNIDRGADLKTIKKAYKKLSLVFHPDKCYKNHPEEFCDDKFLAVKRAYEALTDPIAKENFEKYGNPDGKQSLQVSIGLPTILLDKANRNFILLTYLVIMVIIVPAAVWKYYSDSSKYGEKNVMYDTYSWFYHSLSEHTIMKGLPEVFAGSAEFRECNLPKSAKERDEITKILGDVKSQMQKPKYNHPILLKGNVLTHAHLLRVSDKLSEGCKEDLNFMLRYSNSLIEAMIGVCKHQDWLQSALECIQFGQQISQALWVKDSTLLQLPHFTDAEVKACEKAKNAVKNLKQFLALPDDEKRGMKNMTEEQRSDVLKCCSLIPDLEVSTKVYVDDDEDAQVYAGDLVTVQVDLTRKNLAEGEKSGLVHAPRFPFPKQEAWWLILGTRDNHIIGIDKVIDPSRVAHHKFKFLAPKQGTYEFDLYVLSNAYIGLDQKHKVDLATLDPSALPEYKVHPDDAALDDEPTLFEEMMSGNVEHDSDSEEEDSDDESEAEGIKELSAAERKKQELRNARKKAAAAAGDDDSDDDSAVQEVYEEK